MPQPEEQDARSVSVAIVSAIPVDDKPVVLVSDKTVEVKPLIVEKKDILVCVDACLILMMRTSLLHHHYLLLLLMIKMFLRRSPMILGLD
jgi:hypothetical protein